MFKALSITIYTMFKDQSESFFLRQRKGLRTVMKEAASSVIIKTLKIALSDLFKKERSKLKTFLLQFKMNIHFNELQFKLDADKMLYTAMYLRNYTVK